MTDQQIDEFLEMLAKSPTSARDMVRGLFAAHEAKAAPAVPHGEPVTQNKTTVSDIVLYLTQRACRGVDLQYRSVNSCGWPDLWRAKFHWPGKFEREPKVVYASNPFDALVGLLPDVIGVSGIGFNDLVARHTYDPANVVASCESITTTIAPAAPSQEPVTLTIEEILDIELKVANKLSGDDDPNLDWACMFAYAIIAALRAKGGKL